MSFILKKFWEKVHSFIPNGPEVTADEEFQLAQRAGDSSRPIAAVRALLGFWFAQGRAKHAKLEEGYQKAMAENRSLAKANGKLEAEIREVRKLLGVREKDPNKVRSKLSELISAAAHARELSTRLSATENLLLERTTELQAAQAFLGKTDAVSEAELVGMVENLNTLISSTCGALSDTWDQRDPVPEMRVHETDLEQIRDEFGNSMLEQIAARNRVAVTLAIQMRLGHFIERVTSGWGRGQAAGSLSEIYGMISTGEGQAIASRWRTLTKRYMPQELPQMEEVIAGFAQILMITRSFSDFSEAVDSVAVDAGGEIKAVIEKTVGLDDVIKTKIASSDMSVYVVPPGTIFTKETMTDEFGEGGECNMVAGTTEIGLLQRLGSVEKVLRRPKVILERDLVEPKHENEE